MLEAGHALVKRSDLEVGLLTSTFGKKRLISLVERVVYCIIPVCLILFAHDVVK